MYRSVIEDVINGVKDIFLDEGVDDQALQELRQIWEKKLLESKAIDPPEHPVVPIAPALQHHARTTAQAVTSHHAATAAMLQHPTQSQVASSTGNSLAAQGWHLTRQLQMMPAFFYYGISEMLAVSSVLF